MKLSQPFANNQTFLDPLYTENGEPYGPARYRRLMQECFLISKNMNTSYSDVKKITPKEREQLINFLLEDYKEKKKAVDQEVAALQEQMNIKKK